MRNIELWLLSKKSWGNCSLEKENQRYFWAYLPVCLFWFYHRQIKNSLLIPNACAFVGKYLTVIEIFTKSWTLVFGLTQTVRKCFWKIKARVQTPRLTSRRRQPQSCNLQTQMTWSYKVFDSQSKEYINNLARCSAKKLYWITLKTAVPESILIKLQPTLNSCYPVDWTRFSRIAALWNTFVGPLLTKYVPVCRWCALNSKAILSNFSFVVFVVKWIWST